MQVRASVRDRGCPVRIAKARRGVAAVELAILLPLLCFLFVITVDFARVFYFSLTVTNCARNGAVYGSADPTAANDQTAIKTAAQLDAGNLNPSKLSISSKTDSTSNPTVVTVTVSYPFSTITQFPGVPSLTTITRSVQMKVTPLVPS